MRLRAWRPCLGLLILTAVLPGELRAEICGNCADDDGDRLLDCYDPDCRGSAACAGSYLEALAEPLACGSSIRLVELWRQVVGNDLQVPAVGDVDGDDVPDVVCVAGPGPRVFVIDGASGSIKYLSDPLPSALSSNAAIADVDSDGTAEIFLGERPEGLLDGAMHRLEHDASVTWWGRDSNSTSNNTSPGVADFDGDGVPEVYHYGMIYDATDGHVLVDATGVFRERVTEFTIAADVADDDACLYCAGPELVNASIVLAVDVATRGYEIVTTYLSGHLRGSHGLADWTGDGRLDVIVKADPFWAGGPSVHVWDPRTGMGIASTSSVLYDTFSSSPLVADFDGDPGLEVAVIVRPDATLQEALRLLDDDLSFMRDIPVPENSVWTSATAFDFDLDGIPEIVHRGGEDLRIISALDGSLLASMPCTSGTSRERPVIVDVNADGHVDIVTGCGGAISAFTVPDGPPARRVSNQWHYHPAFINDDLTIPCAQQDHAAEGLPSLMNSWLQQAPLMVAGRPPGDICRCADPPRPVILPIEPPCEGARVRLDAGATTGCPAGLLFQWVDDRGDEACGWSPSPSCDVVVQAPGTYSLHVRCTDDEACRASLAMTIPAVVSPIPDAGPDGAACPDDLVVLDGRRSAVVGCASPEYRWSVDGVVLRDFDADPTAADRPHVTRTYTLDVRCGASCLASDSVTITVEAGTVGEPVGPALRATAGDEESVDFTWCLARPLGPLEHVHVRRSTRAPGPFELVAPVPDDRGFRSCSWTDAAAPDALYFYLVAFATCDDAESE